jgi:tetratricopeptide (TPR) repeat protein
MTIIHVIDEFLRTLFPDIDIKNEEQIKKALTQYFTYDNYMPKVEIKDGFAYVEFDTDKLFEQKRVFDEVVVLCEKGRYDQAKPLLDELIEANPTNSEYYRIRGQIYSDEGNQEEAINYLIDALKWNPKNGWALLMIGNIFAKFKDDIDTAMKYYDQALKVNPDDNISMNNIGANLMQQGNINEAEKFFLKAVEIDDNYPNTHYALGMIESIKGNDKKAFNNTIISKIQLYVSC